MINASIVLYNHSLLDIAPLVDILRKSNVVSEIYLLDNSPCKQDTFNSLPAIYHFTGKNIGYGAAHNIALQRTIELQTPYHLVVNPDISFDPDILATITQFMDANTDIGQLMPKVYYPTGEIQYLCKLIPTPFDLILRRFLPKSLTNKQTSKFELHKSGYDRIINVPYLSGCFMFLRTAALQEVGIFDEQFFMYPEDIDLTRRIAQKYRTVFYPEVSIIHHHAQSSYTNLKMLYIHTTNMIRYFNKWGWFCDRERKFINKKTLEQLKM